MFTLEQIESAHSKVRSGADFPKYIQEISFETWVIDSHTNYFGLENFQTSSKPKYAHLEIVDLCDKQEFVKKLKQHQNGETDYFTFCKHCAETGVEKWIVRLDAMTCVYYDKLGNEILVETIPSV